MFGTVVLPSVVKMILNGGEGGSERNDLWFILNNLHVLAPWLDIRKFMAMQGTQHIMEICIKYSYATNLSSIIELSAFPGVYPRWTQTPDLAWNSFFHWIYRRVLVNSEEIPDSVLEMILPICFNTIVNPFYVRPIAPVAYEIYYHPLFDDTLTNCPGIVNRPEALRKSFVYVATLTVRLFVI